MNRSESISKLLTSLIKAQSEMGNAIKDSKNPFFKSNYADLNALRAEALPLLFRNGIYFIPQSGNVRIIKVVLMRKITIHSLYSLSR